jgi:hypothetical protein
LSNNSKVIKQKKIDALISCLIDLFSDKKLAKHINSYSEPSLWSIIYNKKDGSADEKAYSRFLSWLLHPKENHGLENRFSEFLIDFLSNNKEFSLPAADPIEGSKVAYCKTEALGQAIDILYRNDEIGRAIIIENKTGTELNLSNDKRKAKSSKTNNMYCQLEKYFNAVNDPDIEIAKQYIEDAKAVRKLPKIYIFLHPEGITPAESIKRNVNAWDIIENRDEDWEESEWIEPWIPISYDDINNVLKRLLKKENIEADTKRLIKEFIIDSTRQFDKEMKRTVQTVLFGEIIDEKETFRKDKGVLLSEVMAAIKVMDIDIIEDDLIGAYKEVNDKLLKHDLNDFKSCFEKELMNRENEITYEQAENTIRFLWMLKPKVVQNIRKPNKDVQELIRKLFDFFTNKDWCEKSENWMNIKPGAIAGVREDLEKKLGVKYIRRTGGFGQGLEIFTNESSNATENGFMNLTDKKVDVCENYYISGDSHGDVPNDGFQFARRENSTVTRTKKFNDSVRKEKASAWLKNFDAFTKGVIDGMNPELRK